MSCGEHCEVFHQMSTRATLEARQLAQIAISITDTLGATPEACVELLALRPLLVGAAWKVLDLLLEEALDQASVPRDQRRGYSIDFKQKQAQAVPARPAQVAAHAWAPLMAAYDASVEIRHSLVHRRVHIDPRGALVGVDDARQPLRPMAPKEQVALARAVLGAADQVLAAASERVRRRGCCATSPTLQRCTVMRFQRRLSPILCQS